MQIEERLNSIEQDISLLKSQYEGISPLRDPSSLGYMLNEFRVQFDALHNTVCELKGEFEQSKKLEVETFTDKELKDMYVNSGLTLKEVSEKLFIDISYASRLVNSDATAKNLQKRSELGRLLKKTILKAKEV